MKIRLLLLFSAAAALFYFSQKHFFPKPFEGEEGEHGMLKLRDQYWELSHRSAPGTDWKQENERAMLEAYEMLSGMNSQERYTNLYAGGRIKGDWRERGSVDQAGSVIALDYDAGSNNLYTISDGGMLWRRSLTQNNWENLNRDLRFNNRALQVLPEANGVNRILTTIGKQVWYSDNDGADFKQATGPTYYDNWGGTRQLVSVENNGALNLYFLVQTWDATPWASRIWLYHSANRGETFQLMHQFDHGSTDQVSIWAPEGGEVAFLLNQSAKLYELNGPNLTLLNTSTLPSGVACQLRGHRAANGTLTFYAMLGRKDVYRSTNNGASWQFRGTTPSNAWDVGIEVSLNDPNKLFYGEVNSYRSIDGGANWTLVNEWWEYYGNVAGKLHADIMDIECFRTAGGQNFTLISNHGGLSVSYDDMVTNQNLSLTGLNVSQYYDVRTDPINPEFIYAGSQDQGYQRANLAVSDQYNILGYNQIVSGDYGHMVFSNNGQRFWKQYPGGAFDYQHNPQTSTSWWSSNWELTGDDKPNVGWIVPAAERSDAPALNSILVGGGNINGGSGSHLIELTAGLSAPYSISAVQDPYNFKTNSNSGSSLISAIAVNALNGRRYVATDDGTFFRKNSGGSWQKASGFNGPDGFYLYGSHILPSKINPDLVWFCGSGYSNPGVWKSTDGGVTFASMSNGLPATMVQELAAMPDEGMLFAATDVGPYVYLTETNTWYPLRNSLMPLQRVMGVEMVTARNLVRFGTFGCGVWDFAIDNMELASVVTPSNNGPNSGNIALTTTKGLAPYTYYWNHGSAAQNLTNLAPGEYHVTVMDANGFVREGDFVVAGSGQQAATTGQQAGGSRQYAMGSTQREADWTSVTTHLRLYPNPATSVSNIDFEGTAPVGYSVVVSDAKGSVVHRGNSARLDVSGWVAGTYAVTVKSGGNVWTKKLIKP